MLKQRKKIIGITGGIGSGKTAATDFFHSIGIEIIDADLIAREIVTPSSYALNEISAHFGSHILLDNKCLDRKKLRDIIFNVPTEKTWLEALLHPLINHEIEKRIQACQSLYGILVSPLLFEIKQHTYCDLTILVTSSRELKITRVINRDNTSKANVESIISQQATDEEKSHLSDLLIENNGTISDLNTACLAIHNRIIKDFSLHD